MVSPLEKSRRFARAIALGFVVLAAACGSAAAEGADPCTGAACAGDAGQTQEADGAGASETSTSESSDAAAEKDANTRQADAAPACTVRVPQDYPGLGEAVTAMLPTGGTICVTSKPTSGSSGQLTAVPSGTPPLTIIGYGRDADPNHVGISAKDYLPGLFVRNIALAGLSVEGSVVEITGTTIRGDYRGAVTITDVAPATRVVIDGCDISTTDKTIPSTGVEAAVVVYPGGPRASKAEFLRIQNSFIHDAGNGVYYYEPTLSTEGGAFVFVNNTIANNVVGLTLSPRYDTGGSIVLANNVYVGNATGASLVGTATTTTRITAKSNLFFGNTASFGGAFPPGAPFLTGDPKLDDAVPPKPGAISAAIGQADTTLAPALDFFGTTRGAAPDVGAVQH